jgi:hypothetical protein
LRVAKVPWHFVATVLAKHIVVIHQGTVVRITSGFDSIQLWIPGLLGPTDWVLTVLETLRG